MRSNSAPRVRWPASLFVALVAAAPGVGSGQQVADPSFDAKVPRPAYVKVHPRVLLDEAHHNVHTASGGYKPFADLVTNDGYLVAPGTAKLSVKALEGADVLVIANALGAASPASPEADKPAFADAECDAVRDWVRAGGALLLVADHFPAGGAAAPLARRFGVEMSDDVAGDESNHDPAGDLTWLVFSRENGLLGDHAVTRGRDASEHVGRIVSFTSQSLKGPAGSAAFLKLSATARALLPPDFVLGEAAMLTAQLGGQEREPFGMNRQGNDDRQLALDIMHWLSGLTRRG